MNDVRARLARQEQTDGHRLFAGYPLWRQGLIFCWGAVEAVFTHVYHVVDVNDMFRVSPTVWRHGSRLAPDGHVLLSDGAPVLDLHFQNSTLLALAAPSDHRVLIRGLRDAKTGLSDIARLLQEDAAYQQIQGIAAFTLIHRGIDLLGFHVETLPDTREKRRLQAYMRFLMGMYHPEGFRRLRQGRKSMALKLVWISREELLARYAANDAGNAGVAAGGDAAAGGAGDAPTGEP